MGRNKEDKDRHIHKLERIQHGWKRNIKPLEPYFIFKCVLDCPYFINAEMSVGRKTQCWYCPNVTVLDYRSSRMRRPHCGCRKEELDFEVAKSADELLERLLK